jgi:metal-responsive CopG/Arc/MetJ family transcriptional regulator
MQRYNSVGISLPKNIFLKIDEERGDISRSRFIVRILEKNYSDIKTIEIRKENKEDSVNQSYQRLNQSRGT